MKAMKKIVIYCHGYKGSPQSTKVEKLRTGVPDADVFAWPIHVNPSIAKDNISRHVNHILVDYQDAPVDLIFVGCSLGAYFAAELALLYDAKAVLINPSYNPPESLTKYPEIPEIIRKLYRPIPVLFGAHYFIATNDEVIDWSDFNWVLHNKETKVKFYDDAAHRFDGPEFSDVVDLINKL